MKKQGLFVLLVVTGMFASFVSGLFLGRSMTRQPVRISMIQTEAAETQPAPSELSYPTEPAPGPIDINTASAEQLQTLPGIGPALAGRIIAYRTAHGPFQRVEDLTDVEGIGPQRLEAMKEFITVGGLYEDISR